MMDVVGNTGLIAIIIVALIAVASLLGLVIFASREEKFEDIVAAQRQEQDALLHSLQISKPSKSKKKWAKIKSQKEASKKGNTDKESEEREDDVEPVGDDHEVNATSKDQAGTLSANEEKEKKDPKHKHKKKHKRGPKDYQEKEVFQGSFEEKEKAIESVIEQFLDEAKMNEVNMTATVHNQGDDTEDLAEEEVIGAVEEEAEVEALPTPDPEPPQPQQQKKSKSKSKSKTHDQGMLVWQLRTSLSGIDICSLFPLLGYFCHSWLFTWWGSCPGTWVTELLSSGWLLACMKIFQLSELVKVI